MWEPAIHRGQQDVKAKKDCFTFVLSPPVRAVSWVGPHPNGHLFILDSKIPTPIFRSHPITHKPNFTHHPVEQSKPAHL